MARKKHIVLLGGKYNWESGRNTVGEYNSAGRGGSLEALLLPIPTNQPTEGPTKEFNTPRISHNHIQPTLDDVHSPAILDQI